MDGATVQVNAAAVAGVEAGRVVMGGGGWLWESAAFQGLVLAFAMFAVPAVIGAGVGVLGVVCDAWVARRQRKAVR